MPDGTINIYLDSTFTSVDEGDKDVSTELEFILADNIGSYELPVVYHTESDTVTAISKTVEFFAKDVPISGTDTVEMSFFRELETDSGAIVALTDYDVGTTLSGEISNYISFFTGYNTVSGSISEKVSYIGGENFALFKTYLVEVKNSTVISGTNHYWTAYTNYSGHADGGGFPIPSLDGYWHSTTEYETTISNMVKLSADVDITFAGWVNFPILSDIYSVDAGITDAYFLDVLTISGGVIPHYLDVYSSLLTVSGIDFDVYCSLMDMSSIDVDVELIKGRVGYIEHEIYSTAVGIPSISCDIDLFSLKITNFSLGIGEHTTASEYISVDVLDDVYGVSVSGTYLKVGDQTVPVTFSGIDNGYRIFYDPVDDFSTLNGPTVFTVHAENENDDILEELFYLTFGYIVEYDNKPRIGVDFDYNTKVTVRVTAENYASCPKITADGHRFITEHRENVDLGATIVGIFHADDVSNLAAKIYPESTAYYYGKEFTVVINAKDFANNAMEPFVLRYRIEDMPV